MNATQIERYEKLINYIDERFEEEINLTTVESVTHYSYRNINRIFQSIRNESIGQYVKKIKLKKAADYLKNSKDSISDIAFHVGFCDIATFSKAFKREFNCSPTSYREQLIIPFL